MAFWKTISGPSSTGLDTFSYGKKSGNSVATFPEFYEIEPGIVLDIILDKSHPYFKGFTIDQNRTPADVQGQKPKSIDADFGWVGKALVRLVNSQKRVEKEDCVWASPLEANISEFPLLNELVAVYKHNGTYYYSRKLNQSNYVNANPDFNAELVGGGFRQTQESPIQGNRELQLNSSPSEEKKYIAYQGPQSKMNFEGSNGWIGVLGRYFLFNERIRTLKRREGDMIFESRFGQSIRFAAYDDDRDKDKGASTLTDYFRSGLKYSVNGKEYEAGGGNPMILIRNRQRPIAPKDKEINNYPNTPVPPVKGTEEEKNVSGYIVEDINNDGSSIHLTSGLTTSDFKTSCNKKMWGVGEEQIGFQPADSTQFKYPKLTGDQIVINSDRIIVSSKAGEMFHFSKKRMAFVTDDEFTVDSHNQMVFNTNTKVVINSPAIYLGEYNQTNEPILLGQTAVNWLYDLCEWVKSHTHWYYHSHPDAGKPNPEKTQTSVQVASLVQLQNNLNKLLSRRVFTVGGGLAPGKNGVAIVNGVTPVSIGVVNGSGVPGGWTGMNRKHTTSEIQSTNDSKVAVQSIAESAQNAALAAERDATVTAAIYNEFNTIIAGTGDRYKNDKNNIKTQTKLASMNAGIAGDAAKQSKSAAASLFATPQTNVQPKDDVASSKNLKLDLQSKANAVTVVTNVDEFKVAEGAAAAQVGADKAKQYAKKVENNKLSAQSSLNKVKADIKSNGVK
jgi:hypothetical protein